MNHCLTDSKMCIPQVYHFVILMEYAKRSSKISFFIRGNGFDSLGRTESFCPVLQISGTALLSPTLCLLASLPSSRLSSSRHFPHISYSRYCCWQRNNFKSQSPNLTKFANIFYSCSDETYQKNSVFSRFSDR